MKLYYRLFESSFDISKIALPVNLLSLIALHMRLERGLVLIMLKEMEYGLNTAIS